MTLYELVTSLAHTEVAQRVAELYPQWFAEEDIDVQAACRAVLGMMAQRKPDAGDAKKAEYMIFAMRYPYRWHWPVGQDCPPDTVEVFAWQLHDPEGYGLPYGLSGFSLRELVGLPIYPPSLAAIGARDLLCHALHEARLYGEDRLPWPLHEDEEEESDVAELAQELEEALDAQQAEAEAEQEALVAQRQEQYYSDRAALMQQVEDYFSGQ